jgi:thioredoxin-like negative regulator of GroEL
MAKKRSPVDVRSKDDIKDLERDIKIGPITIVLVYADWCGHCTRFKENVWSKLTSKPHKVNLASVHHDQLTNTSLRNAKITGYPSVLIVGKDGKPAVFEGDTEEEKTNAMPSPDLETLEKIADSDAETIMKSEANEVGESNTGVMTPPDVRKDVLRGGGGNLLRTLAAISGLKRRKTAKQHRRGGGAKKTRRN